MKLKGIDGDPHKRWSMWFNSKQREEPYHGFVKKVCKKLEKEVNVFNIENVETLENTLETIEK